MTEIIPAGVVTVLGGLLWWFIRGRLARDQRDHDQLQTQVSQLRDSLTTQAANVVTQDDCRACHGSTITEMQTIRVKLDTLSNNVADVRERLAALSGTVGGKLDTLTRMLAAKTTVRDSH